MIILLLLPFKGKIQWDQLKKKSHGETIWEKVKSTETRKCDPPYVQSNLHWWVELEVVPPPHLGQWWCPVEGRIQICRLDDSGFF